MKTPGAMVIGASAGGVEALNKIFSQMPVLPFPVIVILHTKSSLITDAFHLRPGITLKEAEEKEILLPAHIYFAPPDYHLLVESDGTTSLTVEEKVNYARPSIDVTFSSAAEVFRKNLVAILLTGANEDGARGMDIVKKFGGKTIVQNPNSASQPTMPKAALDIMKPDMIADLPEISEYLHSWETKHGIQ